MASLGMKGPFDLTNDEIDNQVTRISPGNYALSRVADGTFYVSDVGLTGCRDNVIGMDSKVPISKALTGIGGHFDIPNSCKSIMQIMIMDFDIDGNCINGFKIKLYNDKEEIISYFV